MGQDLALNMANGGQFPARNFFGGLLRKHHIAANGRTFRDFSAGASIAEAGRGIFAGSEEGPAWMRKESENRLILAARGQSALRRRDQRSDLIIRTSAPHARMRMSEAKDHLQISASVALGIFALRIGPSAGGECQMCPAIHGAELPRDKITHEELKTGGLSSRPHFWDKMRAGAHQLTHGHVMTAAEEYRRIAEEFIRLAREAKTEDEQKAFLEMATTWSQRAAQEDGNLWVGTCALKR